MVKPLHSLWICLRPAATEALGRTADLFSKCFIKTTDGAEATTAQAQVEGLAIGVRTAVYEKMFREINSRRSELTTKLQKFEEALASSVTIKEVRDSAAQLAEIMEDVLTALTAPELPEYKKHTLVSKVIKDITADEHGKLVITFHPITADTVCTATIEDDVLSIEMREPEIEGKDVENIISE